MWNVGNPKMMNATDTSFPVGQGVRGRCLPVTGIISILKENPYQSLSYRRPLGRFASFRTRPA
jgi:hypothetical protein